MSQILPIYSKLFHEFASDYGRPFLPDQYVWNKYLAPSISPSESHWHTIKQAKNSLGFYFDFEIGLVENRNMPNAICGFEENRHIIVMYHTFPIALLEFFNRLLCNKHVLSNIGNVELENKDSKFNYLIGFSTLIGEVKISHLDDIITVFGPKCSQRRATAFQLYHYAMALVWEHEIAHAIGGHVHLLQNSLGIRSIDEVKFSSLSKIDKNRVLTYLEFMADRGSSYNVIGMPLLMKYNTPLQIISNDKRTIEEIGLKILASAFLATFFMCSDVMNSNGNTDSINYWNSHPSSLARALNFVLFPGVQSKKLPDNIGYILEKSMEYAAIELKKISDNWGLFQPFGWLGQEEMYSSIFSSNDLPEDEKLRINHLLNSYQYM